MTTRPPMASLDADRVRHLLEEHRDARRQQLLEITRLPVEEREPADEALLESALEALTAIDAALARLAAGTYGTCSGCGRSIPPGRLEVLPYAATCVTCTEPGAGG